MPALKKLCGHAGVCEALCVQRIKVKALELSIIKSEWPLARSFTNSDKKKRKEGKTREDKKHKWTFARYIKYLAYTKVLRRPIFYNRLKNAIVSPAGWFSADVHRLYACRVPIYGKTIPSKPTCEFFCCYENGQGTIVRHVWRVIIENFYYNAFPHYFFPPASFRFISSSTLACKNSLSERFTSLKD